MGQEECFLVLEDGTEFRGTVLGQKGEALGELAVSTAMTGYAESLTDPSYRGQILVFTYPQIGNYGVSLQELESGCIQVAGLVVAEGHNAASHHLSQKDLDVWLREEKIVAISGVDTRRLIKRLRGAGTVRARITTEHDRLSLPRDSGSKPELLGEVSTKRIQKHGNGSLRIGVLDCGVKRSIITQLLREDITVFQLPWNSDLRSFDADGWLISNGPGDPRDYTDQIAAVRSLMEDELPILGICLGHQLMALAVGGRVDPLPFGHRGHNQPVREAGSQRAFMTSQNHGYAVVEQSLPEGWQTWFTNLNDHSNEGMRHHERPFLSVQFHPEAAGGPRDTGFIFDRYLEKVRALARIRGRVW